VIGASRMCGRVGYIRVQIVKFGVLGALNGASA